MAGFAARPNGRPTPILAVFICAPRFCANTGGLFDPAQRQPFDQALLFFLSVIAAQMLMAPEHTMPRRVVDVPVDYFSWPAVR